MILSRRIGTSAASAAASLSVGLRGTLIVVLLGITINWAFLVLTLLFLQFTGGAGSLGALGFFSSGALILMVGVGFPLVYGLVGQHYGARVATRHFYRSHREAVLGWFSGMVEAELPRLRGAVTKASAAGRGHMEVAAAQLPELPRPVASVLRRVLLRGQFSDWLRRSTAAAGDPDYGFRPQAAALAAFLDNHVDERILSRSVRTIWLLVGTNMVALGAIAVALRLT